MNPIASGLSIGAILNLIPRPIQYLAAAVGAFWLIRPVWKKIGR